MKLSKARARVMDEVVRHHRCGKVAYLETGSQKHWDVRPIKALIEMGLIRRYHYHRDDGSFRRLVRGVWEVEMTTAGWDHIYRIK